MQRAFVCIKAENCIISRHVFKVQIMGQAMIYNRSIGGSSSLPQYKAEVTTMLKDMDFGVYGKGVDGYVHYSLAMERIREEDLPRMVAADPHYLLKLHETRGVAFVSEMYVRASLERRETRAGHYREDYPVRDDAQLAWLCLRKDADSTPEFFRVPVPLEQYKHPVTRYYQDNFAFPVNESVK